MALAGYDEEVASTPTAGTQILGGDAGERCTTFYVRCQTGSAAPVLIQVEGLHGSDWFQIPVGESQYFRVGQKNITSVYAKGNGGTATIDFGAVAFA